MRLPNFDFFAPQSLKEAVDILSQLGNGAHIFAGGTDLLVKMSHGRLNPKALITLEAIEGLRDIHFDQAKGLRIGSNTKLVDILNNAKIQDHYPSLIDAVKVMANVEIRNMGTVVGNICNAAPSAETGPPLLAMEAVATVLGLNGEREIPLDDFFRGPGLTAMEPSEIMTSIFVPLPRRHSGTSYKRISARCGVDIAPASAGAMIVFDGSKCEDVRLVLGSVAPIPLRAKQTEDFMRGQEWTDSLIKTAGYMAAEESMPITDCRATAEWRKKMIAVITRRILTESYDRAQTR